MNISVYYNILFPLLFLFENAYDKKSFNNGIYHLYVYVHNSIMCNSQKLETTRVQIQWINKMWYTHQMEYYSALNRKEILTQATTQMNLEDIMLSATG